MEAFGKVKIQLESTQVVAGEYLRGHIIINCNTDGHKVILTSQGKESLKLSLKSGPLKDLEQIIFEDSATLSSKTQEIQETYPFKLKIPKYAPSSFTLNQYDEKHDRRIDAQIEYRITASIESRNSKIAEKSQKFVVISPSVRQTIAKVSTVTNNLKSCWCFPRGSATIAVKQIDENNSNAEHEYTYQLKISSEANHKLQSVVAQVIFEFISKVPGEKHTKTRKSITRVVPNMKDFEKDLEHSQDFSIDLEFSMLDEENSEFYSVTSASLFYSKVYLRILAIYDIGWRSKLLELDHEVPVQPKRLSSKYRNLKENSDVHEEMVIVVKDTNQELYS